MASSTRTSIDAVRSLSYDITPRWAHNAAASVLNWGAALRSLGAAEFWKLWRSHNAANGSPAVPIVASTMAHPFFVRPGTSDCGEFIYTAVREAYGRYTPKGDVQYLLDAGANDGDTGAYLLSQYPQAKLIAIEPDPANFEALEQNCAPYGERANPVQAAIWHTPTRFDIDARGGGKNEVQVVESPTGNTPGVSIPQLMEQFGFPRIDIFKCDIESAELPLFSQNADGWLARTRFIVIETHGDDCLKAVVDSTARHGFVHMQHRNLHYFENRSEALNREANAVYST